MEVVEKHEYLLTKIKVMVKQVLDENEQKSKPKWLNCEKSDYFQRNMKKITSPTRNNKRPNYQPSLQVKLKRTSTDKQVLAPPSDGPTVSISEMQQNNNNLTACGYINGRQHTFTIGTGAM